MILITGAAGQLGRLVVSSLLERCAPSEIVAGVRRADSGADLADLGVQVRIADYERPELWPAALDGVDKVLLIATSDLTKRLAHHSTVINAVREAGSVKLLAFTSLLHIETSTYLHADSERATEEAIRRCGAPFALLRQGWFTENYTDMAPYAVEQGKLYGAARNGRISGATRADYAAAAAHVLTAPADSLKPSYELAGDTAFTLPDVAAEISRQTGKPVEYADVAPAELETFLTNFGYPASIANTLADADRAAARGELADDSHELSTLIGRPTTPLAEAITNALAAAARP